MLRRTAFVVLLGVQFTLAGCGGGVNTVPVGPVIQSTTGVTSFALSGTVTSTELSVTEPGYAGSFTATSTNPAVATVTGITQQGSADERAAQTRAHVTSIIVSFTITAVGNGSTTVIVTDNQGNTTSFPVVVSGLPASPGPLTASPASLTFNGTAQTQSVSVTDPGTTNIAVSGCSGIATLGALMNGAFTVTAVAAGACTISVSDPFGHQSTVAVGVTTLGVPIQ